MANRSGDRSSRNSLFDGGGKRTTSSSRTPSTESLVQEQLTQIASTVETLRADLDSQQQVLMQQQAGAARSGSLTEASLAASGRRSPPPRRARYSKADVGVSFSRPMSVAGDDNLGALDDMMGRDWEEVDEGLVALGIGDLISLTLTDVGLLVGDVCLARLGVEQGSVKGRVSGVGGAPEDCAFRICPKLNYRARREMKRLAYSSRQKKGEESGAKLAFSRLKERLQNERLQNEKLMQHVRSQGKITPLTYGDIIQLEHMRSLKFIGMTKSPSLLNTHNHAVALMGVGEDGISSYFRVVPRFKVRSLGSTVFADDEVLFESVKFDGFVLSASTEHAYVRALPNPGLNVSDVPRVLRSPNTLELSGWLLRRGEERKGFGNSTPAASSSASPVDGGGEMESEGLESRSLRESLASSFEGSGQNHKCVASFQIKLYARFREGDSTEYLSSFNKVRLFNPEYNGYVCASANRDKGEMLDATPLEISQGLGSRQRVGACKPHCAYLKCLTVHSDPSAPANLNAKAVWRFEPVEELTAGVVSFNKPVRLRHVATNLFLAVHLAKPGIKVKKVAVASGSSLDLLAPLTKFLAPESDIADSLFYDCFLTDGNDGGTLGASVPSDSMVFRIVATDEEVAEVKQGFTTIRIEHRTADGQRLYMCDIGDVKPRFTQKQLCSIQVEAAKAKSAAAVNQRNDNIEESILTTMLTTGDGGRGVDEPKCRLGFVARSTGLEAFVVRPLMSAENEAIDAVLKYLQVVSLYAYRYQTAVRAEDIPVDSCEELVGVLLELLDLLHKGEPSPRRHRTVADYMTEANTLQAPQFSALNFGGEVNPKVQDLCFQTKLLDALFLAAVAPYNRQYFKRGPKLPGPFKSDLTANQPAAVQKFLYLSIQRICFQNESVMDYFARAHARVWRSSTVRETDFWRNLLVDQGEDAFGATVLLAQLFRSSTTILKKLVNDDLLERFKLLIKKCGPEGRVINLFASTCFVEGRPMRGFQEACARKLWMKCVDRYNVGATFHLTTADTVIKAFRGHEPLHFPYAPPQSTAGNSACGGNSSGGSSSNTGGMFRFGGRNKQAQKKETFRGHVVCTHSPPNDMNFLGKSDTNEYLPVGVVWRSSRTIDWGEAQGEDDRGGLYWSPKSLGIPSLGEFTYPKGDYGDFPESGDYVGELVPLELILWVVEPERLGLAVTGKPFEPFITAAEYRKQQMTVQHQQDDTAATKATANKQDKPNKQAAKRHRKTFRPSAFTSNSPAKSASASASLPLIPIKGAGTNDEADTKAQRRRMGVLFQEQVKEALVFTRKKQLALYVIDQVILLTQMCRGRCINAIHLLEKDFSYSLLLNMASNPWLPYRFRAAVVHFVLVLYVDRFPQLPKCGAAQLPEAIWIYEDRDAIGHTKKSTMPVLKTNLTLQHEDAFPGFFIPVLSMAYGKKSQVLSMPDHTKFYLLRSLCNDLLQTSGLVYDDLGDGGLNVLMAALLTGQAYLLEFGFQSTIEKMQAMCKTNALMLDGRQDMVQPGKAFNPPKRRFQDMGQQSEAVVGIKRAIIDEFFDLADLRVNYRQALILGEFKSKFQAILSSKSKAPKSPNARPSASALTFSTLGIPMMSSSVAEAGFEAYGCSAILEWAGGFEAYAMFEGLFQETLPQQEDEDNDMDNLLSQMPGGGLRIRSSKHDSHLLQFSKLADKPDFNDVLIDTLLYDNDQLMASSLHLLDVNYGMRRRLVSSLGNVVLLEDPKIAVYGDVHILRADINELSELLLTHTFWCVSSAISGEFDQKKYARLMSAVDTLLEFVYTPHLGAGHGSDGGLESERSSLEPVVDVGGWAGEAKESSSSSSGETASATRGTSVDRPPKTKEAEGKIVGGSGVASKKGLTTPAKSKKRQGPEKVNVTALFFSRLHNHFLEHPEYGTSETARCERLFEKISSTNCDDALLDVIEFIEGTRNVLGIPATKLTDKQIADLFGQMSEGAESVNLVTFESFVAGNGDKENFNGVFVDCDASDDGSYYSASRLWSCDVASKWLENTRPNLDTQPDGSGATQGGGGGGGGSNPLFGAPSRSAKSRWQRAVSATAGDRTSSAKKMVKPSSYHQDILRGCNLQSVLSEAIHMDPDIAFKGSKCTVALKIESQRRLTLVHRALLLLYKAFVSNNPQNQELMFKDFAMLQRTATPVQLLGAEGSLDSIFDERIAGGEGGKPLLIESRHYACYQYCEQDDDHRLPDDVTTQGPNSPTFARRRTARSLQQEEEKGAAATAATKKKLNKELVSPERRGSAIGHGEPMTPKHRLLSTTFGMSHGPGFPMAATKVWPTTVEEVAQDLILSLLRGNEKLCLRLSDNEKQRDSLFDLFAFVANKHGEQQRGGKAARRRRSKVDAEEEEEEPLTSCDASPVLDFFFIICAPTATRPLKDFQTRVAERLCDSVRFSALSKSCSSCVQRARAKSDAHLGFNEGPPTPQEECSNPYRMVRLLKACCQGGNDEVAVLVASASTLVGIEECCSTLLAHCRVDPATALASGDDSDNGEDQCHVKDGEAILRILAPCARLMGVFTAKAVDPLDESVSGVTPVKKNGKRRQSFAKLKLQAPSFTLGPKQQSGDSDADGKQGDNAAEEPENEQSSSDGDVVGSAALTASETYEDGCLREGGAFEVLALLVELVDLLPCSASQVRSPLLWQCVRVVCVPAIDALARNRGSSIDFNHNLADGSSGKGNHSANDRVLCAELVDLLDRLLDKIHHHGLIDDVLSEQYRTGQPMVDDMRDDLKFMSVTYPNTLGKVFSDRTREAVKRIFALCDGKAPPTSKHTRKDAHAYGTAHNAGGFSWMASEAKKSQKGSMDFLTSGSALKKLVKNALSVQEELSLGSAFEAFRQGLRSNPHVNVAILRRRFQLLSVLENGTQPDVAKFPRGCVVVTWEMIVDRFVRYTSERSSYEEDGNSADCFGSETMHIILRLLRDHLVKARTLPLDSNGDPVVTSKGGGKERVYDDPRVVKLELMDAVDLPDMEDQEAYAAKQHVLLKHGCVELMARIIMSQETAEDGDIADEALEVLDELQHGADSHVKECLYELLSKEDAEGRFLAHLVGRMTGANAKMTEGRSFGLLGGLGAHLTDEMRAAIANVRQTINFLTHLCVGHDAKFQDIVRVQPMYSGRNYDLVGMCIELICSIADSQHTVTYMSSDELLLLRDLLTFLYEAMEGPNPENQCKISSSDVPMCINLIVAADSPVEARKNAKGRGCVPLDALCFRVLAAMLEGRQDSTCHEALKTHLEMGILYDKARAIDAKCRIVIKRSKTTFFGQAAEEADMVQFAVDMDSLTHLWTIHHQLNPETTERTTRYRLISRKSDLDHVRKSSNKAVDEAALEAEAAATAMLRHEADSEGGVVDIIDNKNDDDDEVDMEPKTDQEKRLASAKKRREKRKEKKNEKMKKTEDNVNNNEISEEIEVETHDLLDLVGMVEVAWDGKTQRVCFPMPLQARMLTGKSKSLFLDKTRLFNTDKRLELMFGSTDLFIAEMNWVYTLSNRSRLYRLIGRHLDNIKLGMYSLAVLLNINVLLSAQSISEPLKAIMEPAYSKLQHNEQASLTLTFILGAINFFGYLVIMGYVAATLVPIMVIETDKNIARDSKSMEPDEWTDLSAFKWWFVTLVFNVMFIFMHIVNFPEHYNDSFNLYYFLIFGINLPWTLSCVRNYIVVPSNPAQRVFIICFDTVVTKPFLRNHMILQFFSIQGFISSEYFTLMLFDILNISTKLQNVTRAVMVHADSLVLVFYLFVATTISYASFGVMNFEEDFATTHDGETRSFKTTLSAFWFLFYHFSSRGNIKGVLAAADPKSPNWLKRIAFDTAYFLWVGIILFTTITALLVDALGKSRTQSALRDAEEKNVCFMCGMKRTTYDDFSLAPGNPSFEYHCSKDHDPWAYVAYVAHLEKRGRLDRTGAESFVLQAMAAGGQWIPTKTSLVLEAQQKTGPDAGVTARRGDAEKESASQAREETAGDIAKLKEAVNEILALQKGKSGARK